MKRKKPKLPAKTPFPMAISRRGAGIVSFDQGTSWRLGDNRVTIVTQLTVDRLLIRHAADDRTEAVHVSSVTPWTGAEGERSDGRLSAPEGYSDGVWARAIEQHRVIREFVEAGDVTRIARARVAQALGISDRQVRRTVKRFIELRSLEAFLPQRTGPMRGSTYLHPATERLVSDEILRALKDSPDVAVDDLYPMVVSSANALGLRPPGRNTVNRRLQRARRQTANLPGVVGRELEYRNSPVKGATEFSGPLSVVDMDHTVCDVHIVDAQYGYPIGRPVLSLLIDRMTRVILGILLSLEAPSRLSVGLCMHHGVFHKQQWLTNLGIPDACWPGFGLPTVFYTDNGKDFRALSLRRAMEIYGIQQKFRPVGDPAVGGIIERAIGTFMTKVRLLPGASYCKLLGEKPRHAERKARFTLGELTLYIARQVSLYHKTKHDGLGMPPLTAWERAWVVNNKPALPRIPDSTDRFRLTFLPGEWRTVTREGIEIFSLRYQSADLYPLIQPYKKHMIRYDPRDLSEVFVEGPTHHIKVPLCGISLPSFSLWEWREIHAHQAMEGRSRDSETIAAELRANRDLIESGAHRKGRWHDARRLAREEEWKRSRLDPGSPDRVIKSSPLQAAPLCQVRE
jgi:putative transposase